MKAEGNTKRKGGFIKDLFKALELVKVNRKLLLLTFTVSLFIIIVSSSLPIIQKSIFDIIESQVKSGSYSIAGTKFIYFIVIFSVISVIETILNVSVSYLSQKWWVSSRNKLIFQTFDHLNTLSLSFYEKNSTGKIKERVERGVTDTLNVINSIVINIIPQLIYVFVALFFLFKVKFIFGLIVFLSIPPYLYTAIKFVRPMNKMQKKIRKIEERASGVIIESISSVQTIKSFSAENRQLKKFDRLMDDSLSETLQRGKLRIVMRFIHGNIIDFATIVVLALGAYWTIKGEITLGSLAMATAFTSRAFNPIRFLADIYDNVQRDSVSIGLLYDFLNEKPEIEERVDAKNLKVKQGNVVIKNVHFSYQDKKVLNGINLDIPAGKKVAIVGKSGAGKSTLVKLLLRFYDPAKGDILIDSTNIKDATLKSIKDNIAVVIQDSQLFNDTAYNNIKFGNPRATKQEIFDAAKAANAQEFIEKLPKGFQTIVGERGVKLSGGERQRVNIARAILKNPPILILDEATSSLDSENEQIIQGALEKLVKGRTSIIIAHRLSTIMTADIIVVMDKGSITEIGTHADLVAKKGIYSRLFEIQSGGYLKNEDAQLLNVS